MRLTFLLLFAFCLQVSARSFAQNVTFSGKNVSLERVFTAIEKQTGHVVFVSKQLLNEALPVTVSVKEMPLQFFLSMVLKDQPLEYTLEQQTVFIKKKSQPAPVAMFMPISGVITDSLGVPLAGATIRVKGGSQSTVSDNMGQFTINAQPGDLLVITYVGFKTKEYRVGNNANPAIALSRESTNITEVAVTLNTGYQSISRERATGSYSIVTGKQLENKLRPDLKSALEGQMAGMVLTREGNLEVRGISTFLTDNRSPLIVVDGFPISGGLETLNIDNIESVTLLKDAVAASIYGARSSNGVIVVTTKQGKRGATSVSYNGSFGVIEKPDLSYLHRTSAADYLDAETDLYNQNPVSVQTRYNAQSYLSRVNYLLVARDLNLMPAADVNRELDQLKQNGAIGQLQDYLFRNQLTQQHNISLSGGNDKSQTTASAKYITNRGSSLYVKDSRLILDMRNDWKPAKFISVRLFSNVNYSTSQAPIRPLSDLVYFHSAYLVHPYDQLVNPSTGQYQNIYVQTPKQLTRYDGFPGMKQLTYNPLQDLGSELSRNQNLQLRIGGNVNIRFTESLNLDAGGSWTRGNSFTRGVYSRNSYRMRLAYNNGTSRSTPSTHYIPDGDMLTEARNVNQAYTLRAQLNFNQTYGLHNVMAIAGTEVTRDVQDYNSAPTRFGYNDQAGTFATFNYTNYNLGQYDADMIFSGGKPQNPVSIGSLSYRDNRFVSWYANASYEYDRRFLVSGSIRIDQANFFGTDPRFRYKPLWSGGATYKLSNEKFYKVNWLDKLYLRGSYGINGNISLNSGPFLIISPGTNAPSQLTGDVSWGISSPPNNSLRWEKTTTTNLGTDMRLFSRMNVTFDYYLRKSQQLLASNTIDPTYGYTTLTKNVGQINNTGLELTIEGDVLRKNKFSWSLLGTVAFNKNKVVDYNVNYLYGSSLTIVSVNREGYPANAMFSYRYAGLDQNGNTLYYNAKGDKVGGGSLTADDVAFSGTLRPKFMYSLTNTFRYGQFDLAFMLIAKTGNVMRRASYDGVSIQHEDVAKRWRKPGDEKTTAFPKLSSSSSDPFYFPYADYFVESANFLKLRDASLTYNFTKNLLRKAGMANASLTLMGRNLMLLAANSDKRDPEALELGTTDPQSAELGFTPLRPAPEFYLGLRVNF